MTHSVALGVEYDGSKFVGSQRQPEGRTIQAVLESALARVADEEVQVDFAGRTDSGVHATNQVACFRTLATRTTSAWVKGANTYLPDDIVVHSCHDVDGSFDPRRSAKWRRYLYVFGERKVVPALGRSFATWIDDWLDAETLHKQSQCLLGEHDFTSFRAAHCQSKSPRRRIHAISVTRLSEFVVLDIVANAYLLRMVRNIAGALFGLAQGKVADLSMLLEQRDRSLAPPTAPPQGLYLTQIAYEKYPSLGLFRSPPLLGTCTEFSVFTPSDFTDVRIGI